MFAAEIVRERGFKFVLTVEERDNLYRQPKIAYADTFIWQYSFGAQRIVAPVFLDSGEELQLRATWGKQRYSFALLTRRKELIRRWDFNRHKTPDGQRIKEPHKHYWTPEYGENLAYTVDDIPVDDVNSALFAFLEECNIAVEGPGGYQQVLVVE
jgi:hypothetical protein